MSITAIIKVDMDFPTTHKLPPNFTPSPHIGIERMTKSQNVRFSTFKWLNSAVKFLGHLTAAKLFESWECLEDDCAKLLKLMHICTFYNDFSALLHLTLLLPHLTLTRKSRFCFVLSICERTVRDIKISSMNSCSIKKVVMGQPHQN